MKPKVKTTRFHMASGRCARAGHSLLELLVVVAIIGMMITLLGGAVGKVREAARSFECKNKLKTVGFEFFQFADDFSSSYRRNRATDGGEGFHIDDFQEKLYGIDEFWDAKNRTPQVYDQGSQPLMCPAGPRQLERRADLPCDAYPVTPVENVTIGFNMRLRSASVRIANRPVLKGVRLSSRIMRHPSVPLAFDVDGGLASEREVLPYYSAPPAGDTGLYGGGLFWFPSLRHGSVNAAFVGGHVLSAARAERAAGWDWKYQPPPE
jgi:hypothetical protein